MLHVGVFLQVLDTFYRLSLHINLLIVIVGDLCIVAACQAIVRFLVVDGVELAGLDPFGAILGGSLRNWDKIYFN